LSEEKKTEKAKSVHQRGISVCFRTSHTSGFARRGKERKVLCLIEPKVKKKSRETENEIADGEFNLKIVSATAALYSECRDPGQQEQARGSCNETQYLMEL
jgi:hypothetical protein